MAFSISFMDVPREYPYDDPSTAAARGLIVAGNLKEEFLANLYEWTQEEYSRQWRYSIRSLLEGKEQAALITDFGSPATASHLEWWALYREGENVFVQNHLLFFQGIENKFEASRAVEFLHERKTISEDGGPISEWTITMDDLRAFAIQRGF